MAITMAVDTQADIQAAGTLEDMTAEGILEAILEAMTGVAGAAIQGAATGAEVEAVE